MGKSNQKSDFWIFFSKHGSEPSDKYRTREAAYIAMLKYAQGDLSTGDALFLVKNPEIFIYNSKPVLTKV